MYIYYYTFCLVKTFISLLHKVGCLTAFREAMSSYVRQRTWHLPFLHVQVSAIKSSTPNPWKWVTDHKVVHYFKVAICAFYFIVVLIMTSWIWSPITSYSHERKLLQDTVVKSLSSYFCNSKFEVQLSLIF